MEKFTVVTGASSGIGMAIAKCLQKEERIYYIYLNKNKYEIRFYRF